MPRWLLTPRWIGLFVLLLLVVAACVWLGRWQWHQARNEVVFHPPQGTARLHDVHSVGTPVAAGDAGRRVTIAGSFDADRQVVVVDREHDGDLGSWVVTAMVVDASGDPAPSAIPVVRGWLPAGEPIPAPPRGEQRVVGLLEPSESTSLRDRNREPLASGEVEIVSSPELLSLWRPPLYQGFVIQEAPAPKEPLVAVSPPDRVSVTTDWQNAAYAVQWWLFGLFAIFWFGRMVRLEAEDRDAAPDDRDAQGIGKMDASTEPPGDPPSEKGSS